MNRNNLSTVRRIAFMRKHKTVKQRKRWYREHSNLFRKINWNGLVVVDAFKKDIPDSKGIRFELI